ncbi:histidine biosynthesis trifunctional-protein [Myriangium duriaei CBS 260.36]|uniref:Histidine biosynthesis trifunctional protein n=1 Tax=Myriangium duriaei CBS 260.36 TaxID=1168546 RepID=A0A9P4J5N9_9PEZI|nr:histidine biosynthesis trifunctional-protein [Myriangium duriaei CBS 260.36]
MAAPFLPAIDIKTYASPASGLSAKELAFIGNVYAIATPDNLDQLYAYLDDTLGHFSTFLDTTLLGSQDEIISLLDAGVAKVLVSGEQLQQLRAVPNLDQSRLILSLSGQAEQELAVLADTPVGIYIHGVTNVALVEQLLHQIGSKRPPVYVSFANASNEAAFQLARIEATPIIPAAQLTTDSQANPLLINAAALLMVNARTDRPDGLFTTVVTDEQGIALGLVYSNAESVAESLRTGTGVYFSRKHGLWYKGKTSGDTQELININFDCDQDCLVYTVKQHGKGFCHLSRASCFGEYRGLARLQKTLESRKRSAPEGSYTARLFNDPKLLQAKILEEANELCEAQTKTDIAAEAADVLYFALSKCIAAGVSLHDVERNLDAKDRKVKRRKGDAKPQFAEKVGLTAPKTNGETVKEAASVPKSKDDPAGTVNGKIEMRRLDSSKVSAAAVQDALQRPSQKSTEKIMSIVNPIIQNVRTKGDSALLEYTHKFEKATSLTSPVLKAPFPEKLMQLPPETIAAIDLSFENIRKFHAAQKDDKPLVVETMPGVVCSRFVRPIEKVGLYVPGGTAVLPSTTLMLGVPAMVAGCKSIVVASPPRSDGSISPEIVYVAHKVGAESIVLAGGAQAVAAMAYGTESVTKVDKILGPGNQFVTAAKMIVSNDTSAGVSIDMPAGPSEVLVVADKSSNPAFVASDLLSQAEHGVDSQVVLIAVDLSEKELQAIEDELHSQASALPRVDIVRGAIEHSVTLVVKDINEGMRLSNLYAPEHLILQVEDAQKVAGMVENAGSVFIGQWTPESVGDYSAGVNHSLPTYGYAKQYSGVNLASYVKHITSSSLTAEGLRNVGGAVMQLAKVEALEAHRRAVSIRLEHMNKAAAESS